MLPGFLHRVRRSAGGHVAALIVDFSASSSICEMLPDVLHRVRRVAGGPGRGEGFVL